MKPKVTLKPHQKMIVKAIVEKKRVNIFGDPGTGKTISALSGLTMMQLISGDAFPALVVSTPTICKDVWPPEVARWGDYSHLKITSISGTPAQRLERMAERSHIFTISFNLVPWLMKTIKRWPFKTVVVDEASKLRGHRCSTRAKKDGQRSNITVKGAVQSAMLCSVAPLVTNWVNLTGSPNANNITPLWGMTWPLDYGNRLGASYSAFSDHYMYSAQHSYAMFPHRWALDEIINKIKDISFSIIAKDYFDLREPQIIDRMLTLPDATMRMYRKIAKEYIVDINGVVVDASAEGAGVRIKQHQIASGRVIGADGEIAKAHDEKLNALDDLVEELDGSNIIVAYNYIADRDAILEKYDFAVDFSKDKDAVEKWNKGEIKMLLLHPKSAGHGINLQHGGHHVVFYTCPDDKELYEQLIERCGPARQAQSGYDRVVFVYRLIAKGTVDEQVVGNYNVKEVSQTKVKEALRIERKGEVT